MNDEEKNLLYMLCAAVDEEFSRKLLKIGPKGRAFQQCWKQLRDEEACGAAASPLQSVPDRAADTLRRENAALRDELEAARQEAQRLAAQLRECRQSSLPDQRQLEEEYAFLRALPPDAARLLAPYYALDNLPTFLVSCGQFNRLAQCWDACGRAVAGGAPGEPLATCLRRLLGLYNLASADTPAETVEPQPGAPYDCNTSQRINSDGRTVRTLLLPGLRNSGGKLLHKALVRLDQGIS